jgi:hypothetical protein
MNNQWREDGGQKIGKKERCGSEDKLSEFLTVVLG